MISTGYGTMTAVQNLGLASFPLIISSIQGSPGIDNTRNKYGVPIIIFIACVAIAAIFAIWLRFADLANGGKLNASAEEREKMKQAEEREAEAIEAAAVPPTEETSSSFAL